VKIQQSERISEMISRRTFVATAMAAPVILSRSAYSKTTNIGIAYQPGLGYAPLVVMKQKGWLEEALPNIKIDWKRISSSVAIREAMLAGDVHVGAGSAAPFLIGRDRGFHVKLLSVMNAIDLWLVTNNPRIKSIKDFLPEDKIAVPAPDTNQAFVLRKAAQQFLGNPKALDGNMLAMPHPDATQAIITNQIAGHVSSPPFQSQEVSRGARRILSSRDLFGPLTFIVCFGVETLATSHPEAIGVLQKSIAKAISLVNENPVEVAGLLAKESAGNVTQDQYAKLLADPQTKFTSEPVGVSELANFMKETGFLKNPVPKLEDITFKI
jgi:NitT/TauT family transport system substrate-binding protein